jgi:hypothetical protein
LCPFTRLRLIPFGQQGEGLYDLVRRRATTIEDWFR